MVPPKSDCLVLLLFPGSWYICNLRRQAKLRVLNSLAIVISLGQDSEAQGVSTAWGLSPPIWKKSGGTVSLLGLHLEHLFSLMRLRFVWHCHHCMWRFCSFSVKVQHNPGKLKFCCWWYLFSCLVRSATVAVFSPYSMPKEIRVPWQRLCTAYPSALSCSQI